MAKKQYRVGDSVYNGEESLRVVVIRGQANDQFYLINTDFELVHGSYFGYEKDLTEEIVQQMINVDPIILPP